MYLTEQQITNREDAFIELVEMIADDLYTEIDENYEMTQEDFDTANAMMEYFVENYTEPSLKESAQFAMMNLDPNQELVEEFIEAVLDESIGGVVAGAVHGIKNMLSKFRAGRAEKQHGKSVAKQTALYGKMRTAQKSAKGTTGIIGAYKKGKADALEKRRNAAFDKQRAAYNKMQATKAAHQSGLKARVGLKTKIDTKVSSAGQRVAGAAGRVAGSFA